jgi:hypothetical protein
VIVLRFAGIGRRRVLFPTAIRAALTPLAARRAAYRYMHRNSGTAYYEQQAIDADLSDCSLQTSMHASQTANERNCAKLGRIRVPKRSEPSQIENAALSPFNAIQALLFGIHFATESWQR